MESVKRKKNSHNKKKCNHRERDKKVNSIAKANQRGKGTSRPLPILQRGSREKLLLLNSEVP
jgi:hypothetical protein